VEVVYCDNCGCKLNPDEAADKRGESGKLFCAKCAPLFNVTTSVLMEVHDYSVVDQPTAVGMPAVMSPKPVTKFYFCEKCGKRITDSEIERGLGRDKKVRGVYCRQCSVGVATIEFEAIQPPEAPEDK
jgi:DNA-directed RNA polymerase subunit RPC12/RpoP